MYHMQNRMPAPYELGNNPQQFMEQPQTLARGGRARGSKRMILAHMNPHELNIMDHLQGKSDRDHKTGIRSYSPLEELIKNPHIVRSVHQHARAHHAGGGLTQSLQHLRAGGRNGDTELALIGENTHNLFNQLAGHATRNPNTGHPEYFSLGGALSGMWNTIKGAGKHIIPGLQGVAQAALPHVMPMAQKALGDRFGSLGTAAGDMLGNAATRIVGQNEGPANPYHEAIGRGLGRSLESYRSGASPYQAFGQGMQTAGSRLGGGFGSAMEGAGESMGRGRGFGEAMRSGARSGYNTMGGFDGLSSMASNVGQSLGRGGFNAARQTAQNEMSNYGRRALPPQPQSQNQNSDQGGYGQEDYGQDESYSPDEYQENYNQ